MATTLRGTGGNDSVFGYGSDEILYGYAGDDWLFGDLSGDIVYAGDGQDTLIGGFGDDSLIGGSGADTFVADNVPSDITENFRDTIADFSAADGDRIDISTLGISEFATLQQLLSNYSDDTFITFYRNGTVHSIRIEGLADSSMLTASDMIFNSVVSDDAVTGSENMDDLFGGLGNDSLSGAGGIDRLFGETGDDSLSGGDGSDVLIGGLGSDTLAGGADADRFVIDNVSVLATSASNDVIADFSAAEGDRIDISTLGISELATVQLLLSGSGADSQLIYFRNGFAQSTLIVRIADPLDLAAAGFIFSTAASDDIVTGSANADDLFGGLGEDSLYGGDGDDRLFGESGGDYLNGGSGADILFGGSGADTMIGGAGDDRFIADDISDVILEAVDAGIDTVEASISYRLRLGLENLTLTGNADLRGVGNDGGNVLTGNDGNNILVGRGGRDIMRGGAGDDNYLADANDVLSEEAGQGIDTVRSFSAITLGDNFERGVLLGVENNALTGNSNGNVLRGNDGNNVITGGLGRDVMAGGLGSDIFDFNDTADSGSSLALGSDIIADFDAGLDASSVDFIDLADIDAQAGAHGFQAFTFIGTDNFSEEGQVRVQQRGLNTIVQINTAGNDGAEMTIVLANVSAASIDSGDFLFLTPA